MNSALHEKFTQGLWWNAVEALPYQLILALHNIALFGILGSETYGLIGTIFSLIYVSIGFANLGFDAALPTFFADAHRSKAQYKKVLGAHYLPTLCALVCAALLVPWSLTSRIPFSAALLIALIIIVEGFKKGVRCILHGSFRNRTTASLEIFHIVTYVIIVWLGVALSIPITLFLIFGTLLGISTICLLLLLYHGYHIYEQLPDVTITQESREPMSASRIFRQRLYTMITSMSHQFFSGNALVPLFAYRFGLSSAGTLKLISSVSHGALICIQKVFGSTTDALFAQVRNSHLSEKQDAFVVATKHLYTALYGVCVCGIFALGVLGKEMMTEASLFSILLFFVLAVSEQFFMIYERFFITENRAGELMLFHGATLASLYLILYYIPIHDPVTLLQALVTIRVISFGMISGVAFAWWRIRPVTPLHPLYLLCLAALPIMFFWIAR